MSEADENTLQYQIRAMTDMERLEMLCWFVETFPELLPVLLNVTKERLKEGLCGT